MKTSIQIGALTESDLDLVFLLELAADQKFAKWLASRIPGWHYVKARLRRVRRSVETTNGETDLELTFELPSGRRLQILIENKIAANLQPRQLERYRERADANAFVAVLSPAKYHLTQNENFDAHITYEECIRYLAQHANVHLKRQFIIQVLRAAIEKSSRGYNPEADQRVTDFWRSYWLQASEDFPELEMQEPGTKPSGAGFVWFRPVTLPRRISICHKLNKGYVDLQIPDYGSRVYQLRKRLRPFLRANMTLARAGKSAAIRLRVPILNTGKLFSEQIKEVKKSQKAARSLLAWATRHQKLISQLLEPK
jgi:hypothetical protein